MEKNTEVEMFVFKCVSVQFLNEIAVGWPDVNTTLLLIRLTT